MRPWLMDLWYNVVYVVTHLVCTLGFSLKFEGGEQVPRTGPVLLLANHQSLLDPVLVGLAARRHLHYLARKTLFASPLLGGLIRSLNAVPIAHESVGKEGLKTILQLLQQGHAVVVFPEGTRSEDGTMIPFKPGIALLVARAKPVIVPVGIAGAFAAWPYWRPLPALAPLFLPAGTTTLAVSVGQPLESNDLVSLSREELLQRLFAAVQAQAQRAEKIRRKF